MREKRKRPSLTDEESNYESETSSVQKESPKETIKPADGGKDAWLFVCAAFVVEGLALGFPSAFGVFQAYYDTHEPFKGSSGIPVIGTCSMGIMYLGMPLTLGLQRLYPWLGRWCPTVGLVIMCISLLAASICNTVPQLIATQGVLYAIGSSVGYCPCLLYMDEWFIKKKGIAYGIMWAGTGLSGSVFPFILEWLLASYGYRTTLRVCAICFVVLTMPVIYFIKPRLPYSANAHINPFNFRFALSRTFLLHQGASIIQALGFFLPGIYLPTYARSIGASPFLSASTTMLVNIASTLGCPTMGWFADHFHVTTCLFISALGTTYGVLLIWGFATTLPVLLVFCVVYGLFAGSYSSAWTGIMRDMTENPDGPHDTDRKPKAGDFDPVMILGLLAAGRGIGSIVSGPLSQTLIKDVPWRATDIGGFRSEYGPLIIFTGLTAATSGIVILWRRLGWL